MNDFGGHSGHLHTPRFDHAAVLLSDGQVMVMGGLTNNPQSLWNRLLSYLQKVPWIGSKITVTGDSFQPVDSCEIFNPQTQVWSAAPSMSESFFGEDAFRLNDGRVFVGGFVTDDDNSGPPPRIFDPVKKSWSICEKKGGGPECFAQFTNNQILKFKLTNTLKCEQASLFDPQTGKWQRLREMDCSDAFEDTPKIFILKDGKVLVEAISSHLYDPKTAQWSTVDQPDFPLHAVTILKDGTVLRAGGTGEDRMYPGSALFDEQAKSWKLLPDLHYARAGLTLTVLDSGKVLAAGGGTTNCEVFDPATQKWTLTGALHHARGMHSAIKLLSGKVLVSGGNPYLASGPALDSCELYDPITEMWTEL